jgi:hypothetical protein
MPIAGNIYGPSLQIPPDFFRGVRPGENRLFDNEVGRPEFHGEKAAVRSAHLPDQLANERNIEFPFISSSQAK